MEPGNADEWGNVPPVEEQVAEVTVEELGTTRDVVADARAYAMELGMLREQFQEQGVDPDVILQMNAEVERGEREWPPMPAAEQYALRRLVELTAWVTACLRETESETTQVATANATTPEGENVPPGQSATRPSLVTTPGGRLELRQTLLDALARAGVARPGGDDSDASSESDTRGATVATPSPTPGTGAGVVPTPATTPAPTQVASTSASVASTTAAGAPRMLPMPTAGRRSDRRVAPGLPSPARPAPLAPAAPPAATAPTPTVGPAMTTAATIAAGVATASASVAGSAGFQPMGSRMGYSPTVATAPMNPAVATPRPAQSPFRGAIPSYGGMTLGWAPRAQVPAAATPGPSLVLPPVAPGNVPAVTAPMQGTTPSAGMPGGSAGFPSFNATAFLGQVTPVNPRPVPTTVPATPTAAYYGGGSQYGAQVSPVSTSGAPTGNAIWGTVPATATGPVGLRSSVKNAVDMINPFYSDGGTVERARTFWAEFERITRGMDDDLRMTVFRRCIKGKTGEDWWTHSRITDFDTLRVRFHNRFMCISPPQMMERLRTTKRSRGESVEEWADRIRDLCDEASIFDSLMRYQYFLAGIRNSAWTGALQTTMVNSIEEAVMVLLYKNMQIPVERDEDFRENVPSSTSEQTQLQAMMLQMQNMMAQQQQMLQAPRSPRGRSNVAAAQPGQSSGTLPQRQFVGISMAADQRTQEGVVVCGRCTRMGHGRATCPRQNGTCRKCHLQGHYSMECTVPNDQLPKRNNNGGQQRPSRCGFCKGEGHFMSDCPLVQVLCNVAAREAQAMQAASATATTPARQ